LISLGAECHPVSMPALNPLFYRWRGRRDMLGGESGAPVRAQ
jgi:hypothetical protein